MNARKVRQGDKCDVQSDVQSDVESDSLIGNCGVQLCGDRGSVKQLKRTPGIGVSPQIPFSSRQTHAVLVVVSQGCTGLDDRIRRASVGFVKES